MKKINRKQFYAIKRSRPKIKRTGALGAVENLRKGMGVIITRKEWKMKRKNVVTSVHSLFRASGKRCAVRRLPNGRGWAILRVK